VVGACLAAWTWAGTAGRGVGDVVVTRSGSRYEGRVTETEDTIFLTTPAGARMSFPRSMVKEVIEQAAPPAPDTRPADGGAKPAPEKPAPKSRAEMIREKLIKFYLEMYGKHLVSADWITRAMAVISLSRLDAPAATGRLLEVLERDRSVLVRVYAWEALHARNGSLSSQDRRRWASGGMALVRKKALGGDLRVGLVRLVGSARRTAVHDQFFRELFNQTSLARAADRKTLEAMRDALAASRNPTLIWWLIRDMKDPPKAARADFVLSGLKGGVAARRFPPPPARQLQQEWVRWYKENRSALDTPPAPKPYTGRSALLPPAEKIQDPKDPKWHKDLELPRLHLGQLAVVFCVDSTGSMRSAIEWVKRDIIRMMRALALVSRERYIGVTLYNAQGQIDGNYPLTDNAPALAKAVQNCRAHGGGQEAVLEGLETAVDKHPWPKGRSCRKYVFLVGDEAPATGTMTRIEQVVTEAAKRGFHFHCLQVHSLRLNVICTTCARPNSGRSSGSTSYW